MFIEVNRSSLFTLYIEVQKVFIGMISSDYTDKIDSMLQVDNF